MSKKRDIGSEISGAIKSTYVNDSITAMRIANDISEWLKSEMANYTAWIESNCNTGISGAIALKETGGLYYTDSQSDMNKLYQIYLSHE